MVMRLREMRERAGLTQAELAVRMGTVQNTISYWETETALPRTRQLPILADIFCCSIDDLFARDGDSAADISA